MRLDHGGTEGAAQEESGAKRSSSKRKLIDTGRNKMFAKRNVKGQFNEVNGVGESLNPLAGGMRLLWFHVLRSRTFRP
jgi:hypothetical protein